MAIYTYDEVGRIRGVIGGLKSRTYAEREEAETAVADGRCPPPLAPLWSLAGDDPALFLRLGRDNLALTYSVYAFFPIAYGWVYGQDDEPPVVRWDGRTRGLVALLDNGASGLVIKPQQNGREHTVAAIAGRLGVGPAQRESLPGFLSEDLVRGSFFTGLLAEGSRADDRFRLGHRLGSMMSALHEKGICYNDATVSDPEGRSHLLVDRSGGMTLIDFGVSVLLDRHPRLEGEEVFNLLRTDPMFRVFRGMAPSPDDIRGLVQDYGRRLAAMSREEVLSRDLRFTEQGIGFVARRMGEQVAEPVGLGFREGYG